MKLLIKRIESIGTPRILFTSHLEHNTDAGRFYESLGFRYTGVDLGGGDLEMSLRFEL
jgi:hypothetical protein